MIIVKFHTTVYLRKQYIASPLIDILKFHFYRKKYKNDCVTFAGVYTKYKCSLSHMSGEYDGLDVSVSPQCFISNGML